MPYINVNDVYILDNTGKQVDDSVDYANANSNRNLLNNPFFSVNQRNFTSQTASAATLCVDRWYIARCTASLNNGVLSITKTSGQSNCYLSQHINKELLNSLIGQAVTLSAIIDGTLRTLTNTVKSNGDFSGVVTSGISFALENHIAGYGEFVVYIADTSAHTISRAKLELGSYSTLANDAPQDDELECLKYQLMLQNAAYNYVPIGFGSVVVGNTIRMFVPTPAPMNAANLKSNVAITGAVTIGGNGVNTSVSSITLVAVLRTGVYVNVTPASAPATGHTYSLLLGDAARILLDCNL